jgi:hypothetical protein
MKKTLLALFMGGLLSLSVSAQSTPHRICGTMDVLNQQMASDPGLATRMQAIENQTAEYVRAHSRNTQAESIITIPVVFHIVYNTTAQNISDAKCLAQLNQLNLDYARLNADASNTPSAFQGLAANTGIQFCLAQRDPNGNATTGIERRQTTVTSFSTNDNVKRTANGGMDAWNASNYLNIWVCNLSGGVLGYAQFPGGAAATDGVVLLYSSVGSVASPGTAAPYNLGRTATHEVGHWLNLRHIWGDDGTDCSGSDQVSDTPNQAGEQYGCPTYPMTDGCTTTSPGIMFMNYMDYTDDGCMNMFTAGQSARMNALFATGGARVSIVSSLGCTPPSGGGSCGTPSGLAASSITTTSATLSWAAVSGASSYNVQYRVNGTTTWTTVSATATTTSVSGLSAATTYQYQVQAVCSGTSGSYSATSTFTTATSTSCGTPASLTSSSITTTSATVSWGAVSGASSYNVQYRVNGTTTWTTVTSTTNSRSLTGLTANTTYQYQVQAVCSGTSGSYSSIATFTTLAATGCTDAYESNNTLSAARAISTNTDIIGLINSTTDKDWFRFSTTSPNTNIRINLTNLPADYDIRLYNSSGTQLAISQNGSTTSEQIIRNTTTAATYYIQVYGYNGANSTTVCYNLRVNVGSTAFRLGDSAEDQLEPVANFNDFILFPNPAKDQVNLTFNSGSNEVVNVRVLDMVGKVTRELNLAVEQGDNKFSIDVADFSKGIYFVELTNGNERIVKKMIIER